jgi:hypothetical protein
MENICSNETPEQRESRLAMCACLHADMIFRGVRDGLCYFDLYYASPEHSGPKVTLSLPTELHGSQGGAFLQSIHPPSV